MTFLTFSFAVFFILLITFLSRIKNVRTRNAVLLLGNLIFYGMGDIRFIAMLAAECLVAYFSAIGILKEKKKGGTGKTYFSAAVILAVSVLALTRYLPFAGIDVQPLGVSFYTLMVISYVVDVYRGKMEAETDPVTVALYVSFFPQILSGPITKARDMMGGFREIHPITKAGIYSGMQIFLMGALKKVLIADRLAVCSDAIYGNPGMYSGLSVFFGTLCYSIQLYCDFSGYTDMATGIAAMMGFKLARNFNLPYIAKNPTETWKRWHMSLSSWLQEYVYISLGGNRKGMLRQYINLILTMIIGGLWHGVSLTYVLWGLQSGIGLCAHKIFLAWKKRTGWKGNRVCDHISVVFTYAYFLMGTVIFRSGSLKDAGVIFARIFTGASGVVYYYSYFFIYLLLVGIAYAVAYRKNGGEGFYVNLNLDGFKERTAFLLVVLTVIIYGYFGNNVFIYAQF